MKKISRRQMLQYLALSGTATIVYACTPAATSQPLAPTATQAATSASAATQAATSASVATQVVTSAPTNTVAAVATAAPTQLPKLSFKVTTVSFGAEPTGKPI